MKTDQGNVTEEGGIEDRIHVYEVKFGLQPGMATFGMTPEERTKFALDLGSEYDLEYPQAEPVKPFLAPFLVVKETPPYQPPTPVGVFTPVRVQAEYDSGDRLVKEKYIVGYTSEGKAIFEERHLTHPLPLPIPPLTNKKGNPNLDSQLNQLVSGGGTGTVRVIVEASPEQSDTVKTKVGGIGTFETSYGDLIQAVVPVSRLKDLTNISGVRFVRTPMIPQLAQDKETKKKARRGAKFFITGGGRLRITPKTPRLR